MPWVRVHGGWLPRAVCGRGHALCAALRCLWLALVLLLRSPRPPHAVVVDQVAAPLLLLRAASRAKARAPLPVSLPSSIRLNVPSPHRQLLFYCHFPDALLAPRPGGGRLRSCLTSAYRAPLDAAEEAATGCAHRVLVNSKFTAATFGAHFGRLHAAGLRPAVLYPAAALPQPPPGPVPPCCAAAAELAGLGVAGVPPGARAARNDTA